MSSSEILFKSKEIVESSKLEEHEALVSESVWVKRVQIYMDTCTCIKRILANKSIVNNVPSPYTLILLGGILGNTYTTCKLCIDNTLLTLIEEVLNMLLSRCNVESVRNLLLLEPIQSSKLRSSSNLASQILKLCVSHLAKTSENSDDSLTKSPLFRDTLIWLTMELDYPELAGDEFISILQPLGLRLTEDYRPCIQSAGLSVLRNLAHKARIADWRQSNRAEAVISHLLVHRIANSSDSSEALLDEVYSTLLLLTSLLDVSNASHWYNEITERLLFDLLMENRYKRQIVLLQHLLKLINILKASFSLYTQQFTRIVSHILLGPQKPKHIIMSDTDELSEYNTVHLLVLQSVKEFIQVCWPVISPTLLPILLPPLIAFIDLLSWDKKLESEEEVTFSPYLKCLFEYLIVLKPCLLTDVLQPLCNTIPHLKLYLPR